MSTGTERNVPRWQQMAPIFISMLAVVASSFSAYEASRSARAAQRSAIASGKSADVSEQTLRFQQAQTAPNISFSIIPQPSHDEVVLQIANLGAPVSVTHWGFLVQAADANEEGVFNTPADAASTKMFGDSKTIEVVRLPSPDHGMPMMLERNGGVFIRVTADDVRRIDRDLRRRIIGIGFAISNGKVFGTSSDATQAFLRVAIPDDYVPLTLNKLPGNIPLRVDSK